MATLADIYQIKVYNTLGQQAGINVFHARVSIHNGTGATEQQIADAYENAFAGVWKAIMSSSASHRGVGIRRVFPTVGIETYSITLQGAGAVAGDPLPKQSAGIITWRTASPGRRFRGRSYFPFPAEASNDADTTPVAAYLTALGNLAVPVMAGVLAGAGANTDQFIPGIYHRDLGTITDLTSWTIRDRWATQRRRGDYGKTNILPI